MQILKEEEEDAKSSDRCEEKRREWAKHWQCDTEAQDLKDKQWRNEELKNLEDMPRLHVSDLEKAARSYKAKTGVGCDGFHPNVPLDFEERNKGEKWRNSSKRWNSVGDGRSQVAVQCSS